MLVELVDLEAVGMLVGMLERVLDAIDLVAQTVGLGQTVRRISRHDVEPARIHVESDAWSVRSLATSAGPMAVDSAATIFLTTSSSTLANRQVRRSRLIPACPRGKDALLGLKGCWFAFNIELSVLRKD